MTAARQTLENEITGLCGLFTGLNRVCVTFSATVKVHSFFRNARATVRAKKILKTTREVHGPHTFDEQQEAGPTRTWIRRFVPCCHNLGQSLCACWNMAFNASVSFKSRMKNQLTETMMLQIKDVCLSMNSSFLLVWRSSIFNFATPAIRRLPFGPLVAQ